ncbi:auxin-binding protein ABP19a-like [Dioscorea cayenensis subsp. rotundata]|uniref:Germin-like protein n=1 Tax=Dioscorea cayennensis subsp. rotundata TaxID=55577 RepID=A0AB40D0A1_DIOCR|nr:auxin-binding protein ABP19a-like [Dioscorea cayenensis subsp. rotundata]
MITNNTQQESKKPKKKKKKKKKKKMSLVSYILIFFLISFVMIHSSNASAVQDFCVADLALPESPAGYSCKSVSKVTVNDFIKSQFLTTNTAIPSFNLSISLASATEFPAVNGLHISAIYVELGVGGLAPAHVHPGGNEFSVVTQGTILCGFVSSDNNKAYFKTLQAGDAIVFPQGLVHFQINVGRTPAKFISSFSSANPRIVIIASALFGNNLPTDIVKKVTFLDDAAVKKLKAMFGGTN